MNRFYVIVPVVLLAIFGFFYWRFTKTNEENQKAKQALVDKAKAEEAARKKVADDKAKADADKRQHEREAEEKRKADEKRAKWDADIQKIRDDIAKYTNQGNENAKAVAKLEQELTNLRAAKEKANREAFELNKGVERAQVEKRNAEFEIQRLTDMIAKKAGESAMARQPVVAATAP